MRTQWLKAAGLAATTFVLGYWTAGFRLPNPGPELSSLRERIDELTRLAQRPPGTITCAASVDSREIAAEVLRGLASQRGSTTAATAVKAQAPDPGGEESPGTPEMIRAFDSGRELVNRGLGDRHWGNAQAEELRRLLSSMSRAQADELTGELLAAINSGSLQVDVTGAPF